MLTSESDCRNCRMRRVRCDRSIPHCIKCRYKNVICPGYGPQLRWTNSVASRGRFKGLSVHDLSRQPHTSPETETPSESADQNPTGETRSSVTCTHELMNELLEYYAAEIAPFNVWIHSRQNGYSRLVIPLAKTQPVLRLAIMGIAAAHRPCQSAAETGFSQSACQNALSLITEEIRKMVSMNSEEIHSHFDNGAESSEAVLAATLVLSNHSLLESNPSLALFHLQAARVLIKTLTSRRTADDDLFVFLQNQVAGLDVLACTTLFNYSYIQDAVLPETGQAPVLFGSYLNIIHDITVRSFQERSDKSKGCRFSGPNLEDEFELARGASLMAAGQLTELSSSSYRRDFTRLVQSFHHAGLLYACKRIHITDADQIEKYHVSKLFRLFEQFEDIDASMGRLSWPIFIGGICSCDNNMQIRIVRDLCCRLSANSPFKYYAKILAFLEELWRSQHHDWIMIAQEWDDKGIPILAV